MQLYKLSSVNNLVAPDFVRRLHLILQRSEDQVEVCKMIVFDRSVYMFRKFDVPWRNLTETQKWWKLVVRYVLQRNTPCWSWIRTLSLHCMPFRAYHVSRKYKTTFACPKWQLNEISGSHSDKHVARTAVIHHIIYIVPYAALVCRKNTTKETTFGTYDKKEVNTAKRMCEHKVTFSYNKK